LKEIMAQDTAIQKQMQRVGEIVEQFESSADPSARSMAKELLESVMALHGAALERMLELAADAGEVGETIIRKCGRDDLVGSVLLLYGLHPENLKSRVQHAMEKAKMSLQAHSASAELVSVGDDGTVAIRIEVKSTGCGSSAASVKAALEAAIRDAAPDASSIVVNETAATLVGAGFVSLAQLHSGQAMTASSGARAHQTGD
jgi:Fe-S cluster biogenesis protein NfuA